MIDDGFRLFPVQASTMSRDVDALLLFLLAAEGVTVPFVRPLLSPHVFIGAMLIPPVALKLGRRVDGVRWRTSLIAASVIAHSRKWRG